MFGLYKGCVKMEDLSHLIYFFFFNYFSFLVKPSNSQFKVCHRNQAVLFYGKFFLDVLKGEVTKILRASTLWAAQIWKGVSLSDCTLGEKDAQMQDGTRIWSSASALLLISYATWVSCDYGHNFHRLFLKDRESFESYTGRLESYLLYSSENFMVFNCHSSWALYSCLTVLG